MPDPILETGPAALLCIGGPSAVKIAPLRAAAEASPIPLADTLLRQRLRVRGPLAGRSGGTHDPLVVRVSRPTRSRNTRTAPGGG